MAASVYSFLYVNGIKLSQNSLMLNQSELRSQQFPEESERNNLLPESKLVQFFIEKASALLNPVLNRN